MARYKKQKGRIGQEFSAFCKLDSIVRDKNAPMRLKRKAFNECILLVMTKSCDTCLRSNTELEKLVTTQRKIERIMVGVTSRTERVQTGSMTDIIGKIRESKHIWAAHVTSRCVNRWTKSHRMDTRGHKGLRGRPKRRWCDNPIRYIRPTWSHFAKDKTLWKACRGEGGSFFWREKYPDRLTDCFSLWTA